MSDSVDSLGPDPARYGGPWSERGVLAAVLWDPAVAETLGDLPAEAFADPAWRAIWEAMQRLSQARQPVEVLSLADTLRASGRLDAVGGVPALMDLVSTPGTAGSAAYYADQVRAAHLRRQVVDALRTLALAAADPERDAAEVATEAAAQLAAVAARDARHPAVMPAPAAVLEALAYLERQWAGTAAPLPTPWPSLDVIGGGLAVGDFVCLAARPAVGKTTFALQVALQTARLGRRVLFVSYEMSPARLVLRAASQVYGRDRYAWLAGLDDAAKEGVGQLLTRDLPTWPLDWWRAGDRPAWDAIRREMARLLRLDPPLGLVVVDHLQWVPLRGQRSRPEELEALVMDIKTTAERYQLPVLVCQQLRRQVDQQTEPQLGDLGWSAGIEQAADKVWMLDKVDRNDPTSDRVVYVRKHRDGPTGHVLLQWDPRPTRLLDPGAPS